MQSGAVSFFLYCQRSVAKTMVHRSSKAIILAFYPYSEIFGQGG